jgi:hypothetical protein
MKVGDLVKYEHHEMVETGVVVEVELGTGNADIIKVQWINSLKPEWIIYDKEVIKVMAAA